MNGNSVIYTIGHSTRPQEEFLAILNAFSVRTVADIRTIPRSRKNPQYDGDELKRWLNAASVDYLHLRDLGGLRHPHKDSVNTAWRNDSFRGYADYMQTVQFENAIKELLSLGAQQTVAIMCAEAVPWRCHRSLVSDALLIRGIEARHIMSATSAKPHLLTPWAKVNGLHITYPAQEAT